MNTEPLRRKTFQWFCLLVELLLYTEIDGISMKEGGI